MPFGSDSSAVAVMAGSLVSLVPGFGSEGGREVTSEGVGISNSDCDDGSCPESRLACLAAAFSRCLLSSRASFCAFLIADLDGFEGSSGCLSEDESRK